MCPAKRRFQSLVPAELGCHCLLIESESGLILVDTGVGVQDFNDQKRLGIMSFFLGLNPNPQQAAIEQIKQLGFSASDVRNIIPTHLDLDHAGGVVDFPGATIHTLEPEYKAAMEKKTFLNSQRYRHCHWSKDTKWSVHSESYGEDWFGFKAVRQIPGLPPEILLIPLFGHTEGHFGVAVQTSSGWILHAGDAYYDSNELTEDQKPSPALRLFQRIVHTDYELAMMNQKRVGELSRRHSKEVTVICAHDAGEFARMSKTPTDR